MNALILITHYACTSKIVTKNKQLGPIFFSFSFNLDYTKILVYYQKIETDMSHSKKKKSLPCQAKQIFSFKKRVLHFMPEKTNKVCVK